MVRLMYGGMSAIPPWGMAVIPHLVGQEHPLTGQHGLIHHLFMVPGLLHPWGWPPALCMPCAPAQHLNISNSLLTPTSPPGHPEPANLLTPLS